MNIVNDYIIIIIININNNNVALAIEQSAEISVPTFLLEWSPGQKLFQ